MASSYETIASIRLMPNAQRSLTPSKIPVRNSTPQRVTSNPRNLSAGKTRFAPSSFNEADIQHRAPSRSASRRKQRRWENQNIFSSEVNDILMQGLEDEENHVRIRKPLFKVEMRSAFRELFEPKNAAALEAFRMCAEVNHTASQKSKHRHLTTRDKAWLRIEKRLRQILLQSIAKNMDIISFVADLEELVIAFSKHNEVDDSCCKREESKLLMSLLIQTPSINRDDQLEIEFKDSAFHRLILHSVCQYHGLLSKSFPREGETSKVTVVSRTNNIDDATTEDKNSLTQLLYDKVMSGVNGNSNPRSISTKEEIHVEDVDVDVGIVADNVADMKM